MSISTLESQSSRQALDQIHAYQSERAAGEQCAREEIAEAFGLLEAVPAANIAIPMAEPKIGGGIRVGYTTAAEAVAELLGDGRAQAELLAVLQSSTCPLVQKLREELASEWSRLHASDIAEARL